MEIDLAIAGDEPEALAERLQARVCVIGGGIAGLAVAERLAQADGVSVTVLEAGGRERPGDGPEDPFQTKLSGRPHRGTGEARVRALGGCSWTWGGQLLALPDDAPWPIRAEELWGYSESSRDEFDPEAFLARMGGNGSALLRNDADLRSRMAWSMPFSRRNLGVIQGRRMLRGRVPRVVLHATAAELLLSPARDRVLGVRVLRADGLRVEVRAEQFVLAAGTVETCRLLLASGLNANNGIGCVGENFHDHLTLTAATFTGAARKRVVQELRPWVSREPDGLRTHSMKFEASPGLLERLGLGAAMAHVTIEEPPGSGAAAVRALLASRQQHGLWGTLRRSFVSLPRSAADLVRMGWEARVHRRRYVSPRAVVRLQINIAQVIPGASRVGLCDEIGVNGLRRAVVDWRIADEEIEGLRRFSAFLRERLRAEGLERGVDWLPELFTSGAESDRALLGRIDDARHAMGGACMGADARTSAVDPDLRVHGVANLSVASPAVFPDGRAQLPTWTLLALCRRLADRLTRELRTGAATR